MARSDWDETRIPDLTGRRAIVTGASSGIGLEASRMFAAAGADVLLAVRDAARGERAADAIRRTVPSARLEVALVDLADLASVRAFAAAELERALGLDLLVNNAGTSVRSAAPTVDGYELELATNFLGHFALTGLLHPLVRPRGRIVTIASLMSRRGRLSPATTLDDLRPDASHPAGSRYSDSKQAELLFAVELDRRLRAAGREVISVACHPGGAATGMATQALRAAGRPERESLGQRLTRLFMQSARAGAWPTVYAATAPGLAGGELVAPDGLAQVRGRPIVVPMFAAGRDARAAVRLWELAREATGVDPGI